MQISHVEVVPLTLPLRMPYRTAYHREGPATEVGVVFVRIETRQGDVAWGCGAFDPYITGETLDACHRRLPALRRPRTRPQPAEHGLRASPSWPR